MHSLGFYSSGVGEAGFSTNAVDFDGSNDYLTRGGNLTGAGGSTGFTLSFWFKPGADSTTQYIFHNSNNRVLVMRRNTNDLFVVIREVSSSALFVCTSTNTDLTIANGWRHVLIAGKTTAPANIDIYIDDSDVTNAITQFTGTMAMTSSDWQVGAQSTGANKFDGCLSEFYFNHNNYIDLTVEANRRKFIDATGNPVDLGSDGSTPTGASPILYLNGNSTNFQTNQGTGGNFSVTGALADCGDTP